MTQILVFALKEDLLEVIDSAERGEKLIYAKMGRYFEPEFPTFEGGHKDPRCWSCHVGVKHRL